LLQKDYGGANDCTLTSITAIIHYLSENQIDIQTIYNFVEQFGKKYGYASNRGTPGIAITKIFQTSLAKFKMPRAYGKFVKGIGYNFSHIKAEINKGNPIILSMYSDGQDYYANHSVTIIGYKIAVVKGKEVPIITIYDNWYKAISYIDYNKLSRISSIHFSDLTFKQRHQMWKKLKNLK